MNPFAVDILVQSEESLPDGTLAALETAAAAALRQQEVEPPAALSILLADDAELRRLNRDYRGYDKPTDVLSFPDGSDLPEIGRYLGDIAISVPTAGRQAAAAGQSQLQELRLLVVHGVLHLLGHDHAEPAEKERMWAAQEAILAALGE